MKTITSKVLRSMFGCVFVLAALLFGACALPNQSTHTRADLSAYPVADMSAFTALEEGEQQVFFELSVADVAHLMEERKSFVLLCAFPGCPWCETLIGPLEDAAQAAGFKLAFLNTRKNPDWTSNLDIDNYDQFVELFGSCLDNDENGTPHLYVPALFFVREGKLIACHQGVVESYTQAGTELTDEQQSELMALLADLFKQMEG